MNKQQQSAILLSLIEHFATRHKRCDETHVQKAAYFLKELIGLPLNFDFILYKYGPYSFDLSDELAAMRADLLIRLSIDPDYGPTLLPGDAADQVRKQFPVTLAKFEKEIDFVSSALAGKQVAELEALSTSLFIKLREPDRDILPERHLLLLLELKPHIPPDVGRNAINELAVLIDEARRVQTAAYSAAPWKCAYQDDWSCNFRDPRQCAHDRM